MSGPRVVRLPAAAAARVRARLEALDYAFTEVPHAAWSARGEDAVVTFYPSGKLVVAGKGAEAFVEGRLGWEEDERPEGAAAGTAAATERIVGTDEAGKGDYFGPLVTAAVLVEPEVSAALARDGVRDSKDLSDAAARAIAKRVRARAPHAIVVIGPERYNELRKKTPNLNRLLAWCHARAAAEVLGKGEADGILADRFAAEGVLTASFAKEGIELPLRQETRAERHVPVAAASILARATFLDRLERLGEEVGLKLPKGAGAPVDAAARALVKEHGREVLERVAKLHFKNTERVLGMLF